MNLYTGTNISVRSIEQAGFRVRSYNGFTFEYGWAITKLLKIHIGSEPRLHEGRWMYKLIMVFDVFIAILSTEGCRGNNGRWSVLRHSNLAPRLYVDAIWSYDRIFAVTSDDGDVFVWQPYTYG